MTDEEKKHIFSLNEINCLTYLKQNIVGDIKMLSKNRTNFTSIKLNYPGNIA